MQENSTIEQLLETSGQDQLSQIPILTNDSFYKRITKEQIKGWSSGHSFSKFQKQKGQVRGKEGLKSRTVNFRTQRNDSFRITAKKITPSNSKSLRQINYQSSMGFRSLSKMVQRLPELSYIVTQKNQSSSQIQKLDFVKGKKIECHPPVLLVHHKSHPKHEVKQQTTKKKKTDQMLMLPEMDKTPSKSAGKQKPVLMIAYPINMSKPYQPSELGTPLSLSRYLKNYKRSNY